MKDADDLDPVIQMFLNFGFMDVGMVGEDTANELYDLTDKLFKCKSDHVYTMFEWLKSIYERMNQAGMNLTWIIMDIWQSRSGWVSWMQQEWSG